LPAYTKFYLRIHFAELQTFFKKDAGSRGATFAPTAIDLR
jgi:hypothetical protein